MSGSGPTGSRPSGERAVPLCQPPGGRLELPDVEAILDALEAAVVTPETLVFDAARQSWQPVGRHPEVRAAWPSGLVFSPPARDARSRPPRSPDGPGEQELRHRAWEMVKPGNRVPLAEPAPAGRRGLGTLAVAALVLVVLLLGWGVLTLPASLLRMGRGLVPDRASALVG